MRVADASGWEPCTARWHGCCSFLIPIRGTTPSVTATLIPETSQARLATTAAGPLQAPATGAAPGGGVSAPVADGSSAQGAFSALLLALRPNATTAPESALPAIAADGTVAPETPLPEPLTSLSTPARESSTDALAADPVGGGGEPLPTEGNGLPLPDIDALLASLAAPGTVTTPTAAAPAAQPDGAQPPPSGPVPVAGMPEMPAEGPAEVVLSSLNAGVDARTSAASDDPLDRAAPQASGLDSMAARGEAARVAPGNDGARAVDELALPAEARARLEAALNPAPRFALSGDAGAAVIVNATQPPAATSAGPPAAQPAVLSPFEALPALEPLADRDAWSQGLGERLLLMAERGMQSATLRLQPEHLGPMQIRINVDEDGAAQVLFSAHQATTREALEQAIPRLRELFADQGLTLMQANVDAGRNGFAQRGFATASPAWANWSNDDRETATLTAASAWQIRPQSDRRVDVFV